MRLNLRNLLQWSYEDSGEFNFKLSQWYIKETQEWIVKAKELFSEHDETIGKRISGWMYLSINIEWNSKTLRDDLSNYKKKSEKIDPVSKISLKNGVFCLLHIVEASYPLFLFSQKAPWRLTKRRNSRIKHYLKGRGLLVGDSNRIQITYGVRQGSILGSLFISFISTRGDAKCCNVTHIFY